MIIIGCDFHPSWQMISWLDRETGETGERKLMHATGEARQFYAGLAGAVRVGLESTGNSHWFVDLLTELGHEVWIGDAARIRASYVRKQKTDRRDAEHILGLLVKNSFPRQLQPVFDTTVFACHGGERLGLADPRRAAPLPGGLRRVRVVGAGDEAGAADADGVRRRGRVLDPRAGPVERHAVRRQDEAATSCRCRRSTRTALCPRGAARLSTSSSSAIEPSRYWRTHSRICRRSRSATWAVSSLSQPVDGVARCPGRSSRSRCRTSGWRRRRPCR